MLISCQGCPATIEHCDGCMVTAMRHIPLPTPRVATQDEADISTRAEVEWSSEDLRVLDVLCDAGLVSGGDAAEAHLERTSYRGREARGWAALGA